MKKETQNLLIAVNRSIIKMRGAYAAWAKNNGMNYHELLVLYSLRDEEECTQKSICNSYFLPKQTVHNIITGMKKAGYLELVLKDGSKKEKVLRLTESGKRYAQRVMKPLIRIEEQALSDMGEENVRRMTELAFSYGQILEKEMALLPGVTKDEQ